jgi:RNA polymerase sigma factor (sigma-70 family)
VKSTTDNRLTDNILVGRVLDGDTRAFSLIISHTERLVTQIVFKMISHEEDKKDIAQDIYLKAFHKLGTFRFQSKLSTWIAQIAYNTCFTHLQQKKSVLLHDFYPGDDRDDESAENSGDHDQGDAHRDIESGFLKKELAQILKTEIDRLSPLYKTLITLFHQGELSHAEIAAITQLPEGTIKSYLFRARKILRTNLLQHYKKEEL